MIALAKEHAEKRGIRVIKSYTKKSKKRKYEDFVGHFNQRYRALSSILMSRSEMQGATAIGRVKGRGQNETVAVIGLIKEKSITKNGNVMLTLEDQSGEMKALVTPKRKEVFEIARDTVLDEVIGISGNLGDNIIFINELYLPDIPLTHELKKGPKEEYLAVIGDPQVGGMLFLYKEFEKLIAWFDGKIGNEEQRQIAKKVKYIVVIGDLVEGVGVYPGQEKELYVKDIKAQYRLFANLMKRLPEEVEIICIPGNHDAGRIAEPQPPIFKDFAEELYAMPNVTVISSPGIINVGVTDTFPGFSLLLYHGYSLIYYADNVPSIRERGGQKRAEIIMKFLLQRRHLAPTHGSNLYIPDPEKDPLVIEQIPDFFITGHIHRMSSANYRGVTLLNASAWCDITENQVKRGLEPQPARLPVVNLQTRDIKVINFYTGRENGILTEEEAAAFHEKLEAQVNAKKCMENKEIISNEKSGNEKEDTEKSDHTQERSEHEVSP
jgi:DNA polymerase II small subunit